jgi:HEAT repeat protein
MQMPVIDKQAYLLLKRLIFGVLALTLVFFPGREVAGQKGYLLKMEETKVDVRLLEEQLNQLNGDARATASRLGRSALSVLLKRTKAASPRERALVLECLAEVKGEEAVQALIDALNDPEQDVWNTALNLLHVTHSPGAVGPLSAFLAQSPHPRIRGEVARILGRMGASSALPAIKSQLGREEDREAAFKMKLAIAKLEDGPERQEVLSRLSHEDPKIRYKAIGELEYINEPTLVKRLLPLLSDEARVVNVGQERWPIWHRVCDRALEAVSSLTGKTFPFPTGNRVYNAEQLRMARELIAAAGK